MSELHEFLKEHPFYTWYKDGKQVDVPVLSEPRTNKLGNTITDGQWLSGDGGERYYFDFEVCTPEKGWRQYDTSQDAHYFGVWVNMAERMTFTYAEGDLSLVECPTVESFKAELDNMAECYGDPPPAWVAIDTDTGQVTNYYDERPASEEVQT